MIYGAYILNKYIEDGSFLNIWILIKVCYSGILSVGLSIFLTRIIRNPHQNHVVIDDSELPLYKQRGYIMLYSSIIMIVSLISIIINSLILSDSNEYYKKAPEFQTLYSFDLFLSYFSIGISCIIISIK